MIGVITAAIAPGIAFLTYLYLKDRYDAEPISMIIKTFVIGILIVFPIIVIQYAFEAENMWRHPITEAFILNGLLEEFIKWFAVIYVAFHHMVFNERYDGIIYAASVSLGFATAENIFYLYAYGIDIAMLRALLPVSCHALVGIIMGYYIGLAKFRPNRKMWLILALVVGALLHGMFDWVMAKGTSWIYLMIPFMLFLWWSAFMKIKKSQIQDTSVFNQSERL